MTNDDTLKAALAVLAQREVTETSAHLTELLDALDIPGAVAAYDQMEAKRGRLLLAVGGDRALEALEAEMRAAQRDIDRRRAASTALLPLITAAKEREAKAAIESLAGEAGDARLRALQAYVDLDAAALHVVSLLNTIRREEAFMTNANVRLREAGRNNLTAAMPMVELGMLARCDGQWLPILDRWNLHGYLEGPTARLGDAEARTIIPERRFGRLAELLPAPAKPRKAA